MQVLIIGATGYIGSAVARNFLARGHRVAGLARSAESAAALTAAGVEPIAGDVTDTARLGALVAPYEAVVFAPFLSFDAEAEPLEAIIRGMSGSGRTLLYTSGTGVLSIPTREGQWREETYAEEDPYVPQHWLSMRVETEKLVRAAGLRGMRGIVIRPPMIWGRGGSRQVTWILESVKKTGAACYIGAGLNLYSHVNVDDLAELYALALERGANGALYHAVAGEVCWRVLAEAIAGVMGCGTRSLSWAEAVEIWGELWADLAYGVSSRSRAVRSRGELGWTPTRVDLVDYIRRGSFREAYAPRG